MIAQTAVRTRERRSHVRRVMTRVVHYGKRRRNWLPRWVGVPLPKCLSTLNVINMPQAAMRLGVMMTASLLHRAMFPGTLLLVFADVHQKVWWSQACKSWRAFLFSP